MITVTISINGKTIYARSARHTGDSEDGVAIYTLDTGDKLLHVRKDGAVVLAKKMLDTIFDI